MIRRLTPMAVEPFNPAGQSLAWHTERHRRHADQIAELLRLMDLCGVDRNIGLLASLVYRLETQLKYEAHEVDEAAAREFVQRIGGGQHG